MPPGSENATALALIVGLPGLLTPGGTLKEGLDRSIAGGAPWATESNRRLRRLPSLCWLEVAALRAALPGKASAAALLRGLGGSVVILRTAIACNSAERLPSNPGKPAQQPTWQAGLKRLRFAHSPVQQHHAKWFARVLIHSQAGRFEAQAVLHRLLLPSPRAILRCRADIRTRAFPWLCGTAFPYFQAGVPSWGTSDRDCLCIKGDWMAACKAKWRTP